MTKMFRFIAGIITGTAITVIGWETAVSAVIEFAKQIIDSFI